MFGVMKVIIAPQSFKGSISALDVARAMKVGVLKAIPKAQTMLIPVADGGDGTLETLVQGSDGQIIVTVSYTHLTLPTNREV